MTEQSLNNYFAIEKIVENNFDLDSTSLMLFKEKLYTRKVDDAIGKFLDEDLRLEIPISKDDYETRKIIDEGYKSFKDVNFLYALNYHISDKEFIEVVKKISYKEFIENKIELTEGKHKNVRKLYKTIFSKIDIHKEEGKEVIADYLNTIDQKRLPKETVYFVVSFNYADMFLSATRENWSSCLNLESGFYGSYWAGLPSIIMDSNRGMFYITDKKSKEYNGIKVDRVISRSWAFIGNDNSLMVNLFYPVPLITRFNITFITNLFPFLIRFFEEGEQTKNPIRLLRNNNNQTIYPFQDFSSFVKDASENYFVMIFSTSNKGNYYFDYDKNSFDVGKQYRFSFGLKYLIDRKESLSNYYFSESQLCSSCGDEVAEGDEYYDDDGNMLCLSCHNIQTAREIEREIEREQLYSNYLTLNDPCLVYLNNSTSIGYTISSNNNGSNYYSIDTSYNNIV